jgi:RNA polymerase sigma-70 factor (sigma-E family)
MAMIDQDRAEDHILFRRADGKASGSLEERFLRASVPGVPARAAVSSFGTTPTRVRNLLDPSCVEDDVGLRISDGGDAVPSDATERPRAGSRMDGLYARHIDAMVRLAYLMTGDHQTAEDLAQEAFIKTFGRWRHLRQGSSFEAYLRTTVVNLARSHFRRRSVERRSLSRQGALPPPVSPETGSGLDGRLREALLGLPQRQRAAVVLRYYEDLSEAQTAEMLHCSVGNVKALASKGMARLREVLADGEPG